MLHKFMLTSSEIIETLWLLGVYIDSLYFLSLDPIWANQNFYYLNMYEKAVLYIKFRIILPPYHLNWY